MQQEALVQTIITLAGSLVDDFDTTELLTSLSARCVAALDLTAAGVMLAAPNGRLQVIASSSDAMRILELFEVAADEGPSFDCYRTGEPVVNRQLSTAAGPWPRFTHLAVAYGFRSAHSLPMRLRGRTVGALNMFSTHAGGLEETDVTAAQALADVATIAVIQHHAVADPGDLDARLTHVAQSRAVIERAKSVVAQSEGLNLFEAFQRFRDHAHHHNIRLSQVARDIAQGTVAPGSLDPLPRPPGMVTD